MMSRELRAAFAAKIRLDARRLLRDARRLARLAIAACEPDDDDRSDIELAAAVVEAHGNIADLLDLARARVDATSAVADKRAIVGMLRDEPKGAPN